MPAVNLFREAAWTRNPAWVQLLGLCPLLAVTTTLENAAGLAVASAVVVVGSTVTVSALRAVIPDDVRLPCFMVVVATFTTLVTMLMEAFAFDLYQRVALFVQIIVTNCMILGRIEQFASRQPMGRTLVDALGTAAGFAVALLALGATREFVAMGMPLAALPPGAFLVAGLLFGGVRAIGTFTGREKPRENVGAPP